MATQPLLTVVLSTRNHCSFLPACIHGILMQTWSNFEFLISDDGSTDNTWDFLEKQAKADSRLHLIRNKNSMGVIKAYNQLFQMAKGRYVWSVAADDTCIDRTFLWDGFHSLRHYPNAAGFYGGMRVVHAPQEVFVKAWTAGDRDRFLGPMEIMKLFWNDSGYPPGPSLVLERQWYAVFNGWRRDLGPQCDYFLNVLAGGTKGMVYLHRESVIHRVWDAGNSFLASQNSRNLIENLGRVERLLRSNLPTSMDHAEQWNRWRINVILRATNIEHQFRIFKKTKRINPVFDIFPLLRNLFLSVKAYHSGWHTGDTPELSKAEDDQKLFVVRLSRQLWKQILHDSRWRVVLRIWRSLRKRSFPT